MSKSYRINVKNLHYAILTKDDNSSVSYDTPVALEGLRSIKMSVKTIEGELHGDGTLADQQVKIDSIGVDFDINKIALKDRAKMQGSEYNAGIMEEKATDKIPYLALGFEIEGTKGSEFIWLYKGKMNPLEDEGKQTDGNINYTTQKSKFTFIPRDFDDKIRKFADSSEEGFVETTATQWFTAVPTN